MDIESPVQANSSWLHAFPASTAARKYASAVSSGGGAPKYSSMVMQVFFHHRGVPDSETART
jgi:hypothetical protein